ncbi:MAG: response regulator [Gammaproteobacteria bacterium]|nr:response regulator [Gammaproteobacteria bacterium]
MEDNKSQQLTTPTSESLAVLIADDDPPTRILLRAAIQQWGYKVVAAQDGEEAWTILQQPDAPRLLIVDWLMPKLNGIDLCLRIKEQCSYHPYTILLTQITGTENIVKGLEAGADEFLSKPFNMAELHSRLSVGARIITYENALAEKNRQLQLYLQNIKSLTDLGPAMKAEISEIITTANTFEKTDITKQHLKIITDLQSNLVQVAELLEKCQLPEKG